MKCCRPALIPNTLLLAATHVVMALSRTQLQQRLSRAASPALSFRHGSRHRMTRQQQPATAQRSSLAAHRTQGCVKTHASGNQAMGRHRLLAKAHVIDPYSMYHWFCGTKQPGARASLTVLFCELLSVPWRRHVDQACICKVHPHNMHILRIDVAVAIY